MEVWVQLISSVGFPIACCIAMAVFIYQIVKAVKAYMERQSDYMEKQAETQREENEKFRCVLNDLTESVNKLVDRLEV